MTERSHLEAPVAAGASTFAKGKKNLNLDSNFLNAGRDIGNIVFMKCSHDLCETVANAVLHSDTSSAAIEEHNASPDPELDAATVDVDSTTPHTSSVSRKLTGDVIAQFPMNDPDLAPIAEASGALSSIQAIPTDDRRELLRTKALSRAPSSCEVYVKKMYKLNHGYPLWYPQPDRGLPVEYRRKGVSIGDVGVVTYDGAFDFLFNIWIPACDPINPNDLSSDFDTIPRPERRTMFRQCFTPGYNSKLSNLNITTSLDSNSGDVTFTCTDGSKGVLLWIPHGASAEDLRPETQLLEFISKNALWCYGYAGHKCGLDVDRHSLYLVTGCTKSKTWGIATFDKSSNYRNTSLSIGKSNDINTPYWSWINCGEATHTRTGPTADHELVLEDGVQVDENQCLFLRGFKVSLSEEEWDNILHPPDAEDSGPSNDPSSSDRTHEPRRDNRLNGNNGAGGSAESQNFSSKDFGNKVKIDSFPEKGALFHPSTAINNALLSQCPEARIAVTHDNTWSTLISQKGDSGLGELTETIKNQYIIGFNKDSGTCTLELRSKRAPDDESQSHPTLSTLADMDRGLEHHAQRSLLTDTGSNQEASVPVLGADYDIPESVLSVTTAPYEQSRSPVFPNAHDFTVNVPVSIAVTRPHHFTSHSWNLTGYNGGHIANPQTTWGGVRSDRDTFVPSLGSDYDSPESAISIMTPPSTQSRSSLFSGASQFTIHGASFIENAAHVPYDYATRDHQITVCNAPEDTLTAESPNSNFWSDEMFGGAQDFTIPDQWHETFQNVSPVAADDESCYSDNVSLNPATEHGEDRGGGQFAGVWDSFPRDYVLWPDSHDTGPRSTTDQAQEHSRLTPPPWVNQIFSNDISGNAPHEGDEEKDYC